MAGAHDLRYRRGFPPGGYMSLCRIVIPCLLILASLAVLACDDERRGPPKKPTRGHPRNGPLSRSGAAVVALLQLCRDFPGKPVQVRASRAFADVTSSPPTALRATAVPWWSAVSSRPGRAGRAGSRLQSLRWRRSLSRRTASCLATSSWDNTVRLWRLGGTEPKDGGTLEASPDAHCVSPGRQAAGNREVPAPAFTSGT